MAVDKIDQELAHLKKLWIDGVRNQEHVKPSISVMALEIAEEVFLEAAVDSIKNDTTEKEELKLYFATSFAAMFDLGLKIGSDFRLKLMYDGFTQCNCENQT